MINGTVYQEFMGNSYSRELEHQLRKDKLAMSKGKSKFIFLFDTFQQSLKEQYNITEYDLGLLLNMMAHQRFREHEETQSYIHYKGKRAEPKHLEKMLKINRDSVAKFKRQMLEKNILQEDEHGMFLNEEFTTRGKMTAGKEQYNRVFVNGVTKVYDVIVKDSMDAKEKKQAIKDVGLLFSLFPFMNKETNQLVDENFNNITMNELKSKLGFGRNHPLEERLGRINQAFYDSTGKYLIYKLEPVGIQEGRTNKKAFRLIINPRLVFSTTNNKVSKLDAELFGDSETSKESEVTTESNTLLLVINNDLFFIKTNNNYNVTTTLEKIQEHSILEFQNNKFKTSEVQNISLVETSELENYIDKKYLKNELTALDSYDFNKDSFYKDLYLN